MTKEQEEAISRLRKITNRQILYGNKFGITIEGFKELQEDLETVLNMQKEKDAEIEKYKKLLADNLAKNLNDSIKAKEKADTDIDDLNKGWQVELEKYKQLYNKALDDSVITAHDNMKKDKEIKFLKDINKQEKDRHKQSEKSLKGQIKILKRDFKIVDQECSRLERKEAKQDKMIDLMAEWISERCLYIDDYGNSCEIIQDSCNKKENCELCIKQYFERKLEDERNKI